MTKKILAMFLAVLMVVSVLPASVLAADSDCPIAKGKHNLDNCTDYTVKKVVDATCAAGGYTLYACDACGDTFIGNATAALTHDPKAETVTKIADAVEPTFTEVGYTAKYHCSVCDEDFGAEEIPAYKAEEANKLFKCDEGGYCVLDNPVGKACSTTGQVRTCANGCGRKIVSREDHTLDFDGVKIEKEPTATENGEATLLCTVCGEKATIIIYPNHDHVYEDKSTDTLAFVEEAYDCVTGGYLAHLKCAICGKLFVEDENGALVEKTLDELKGEPVESGKHTCVETKEESDDGETEAKDVNCSVDGVKIYDCSVCEKEIIEVVPAGHDWEEDEVIAMTCGQDGITTRECKRCGFTDVVTETAPQHTTLEEYQAAFNAIGKEIDAEALEALEETEIAPECYVYIKDGEVVEYDPEDEDIVCTGFLKPVANSAVCGNNNGGTYTWNCLNCGEIRSAASPKLEHNLVEYTVPATCAAVSYTFKYCTNANCGLTATGVVKDADNNEYSAVVKTKKEVIEAVLDEDEEEIIGYAKVMVDEVIATPKVSGKITAFGTSYDEDAHRFGLETTVDPTCTTAGNYYKKCADCGYEEKSTPAALGHTLITNPNHATKAPVVVEPTCKTPGSITYYCKTCGEFLDEDVEDGKYIEVLDKVTDLQYTDEAAMNAAHQNLSSDAEEYSKCGVQVGTCTQFGYTTFYCTECNHYVVLSDGITGMGHKDSKEYVVLPANLSLSVDAIRVNGAGYRIMITAVKGEEIISSGKIPGTAVEVDGGVKIENFGEEVQVEAYYFTSLTLDANNFASEEDAEVEYSYDSYVVTVKYYTHVEPTCREVAGKQGQDGKIVAHNCINEWCDTDLTTEGAQVYEYAEKKINKLSHNYETVKEAVTGVCGEVETRALIKCSRCGDTKDLLKSNGEVDKADYYDGKPVNDVKPGWNIDNANCEENTPLYDIYYCAECETYHIRNYMPAVEHTWGEGYYAEDSHKPTCASDGKMTYKCSVCEKTKEETVPATMHKNSDGEYFTDHCNDTETNRHCVVCCNRPGKTDCATKKTSGVYDCAGMIGKNHSGSFEANKKWYPATCTTAGYWMFDCEYCDVTDDIKGGLVIEIPETYDGEENKPGEHQIPNYLTEKPDDWTETKWIEYQEKYTEVDCKAYLSYTEATVAAAGQKVYECSECGGVITETIDRLANLQFYMEASNANAHESGKYTPGSLIALTVKATGIDAALAGFGMNIGYIGATYVGYDWILPGFVKGVTEPTEVQGNKINVMGYIYGEKPEMSIADEKLVVLYFRATDAGEVKFTISEPFAQNALEDIENFNTKWNESVTVGALIDVDGDGKNFEDGYEYALKDLKAAIALMYAEEGSDYNVAADINRDGKIDMQDLTKICSLASKNIDIDDVLLLNLYNETEAALHGLCIECGEKLPNHAKDCSEYVKP